MADIRLTVQGENQASGALSDAGRDVAAVGEASKKAGKESAEAAAQAIEKWHLFAEAAKEVIEKVIEFGREAVKSYQDAERVNLQLERAVGDLSGAFEKQAEVLSRKLAIDDDVIKQQQTFLAQFGAAPALIGDAIVAINNYAAATGKYALTATNEFWKAMETGGGRMKALGIEFEATGNKTKDLAALIKATNDVLGGAAETNANSLTGNSKAATIAMEELSKAVGELITKATGNGSGVRAITEDLRGLKVVVQDITKGVESLSGSGGGGSSFLGDVASGVAKDLGHMLPGVDVIKGIADNLTVTRENLKALARTAVEEAPKITGDQPLHGGNITAKGAEMLKSHQEAMKKLDEEIEKDKQKDEERAHKDFEDARTMDEHERQAEVNAWYDKAKISYDGAMEIQKIEEKQEADKLAFLHDAAKKEDDIRLKQEEELTKMMQEKEEQRLKDMEKEEKKWQKVGDTIGGAFVNAIASEIEKLQSGGDIDAGEMVGDILAVVAAAGLTALGTYFNMPALGAAAGNLAAMGITAATRKHTNTTVPTMHDGGWAGGEVPRFHDGSWIGPQEVPAILQTGERVLSRQEVKSMGGSQAIDGMAKGRGPGLVVNVSSLDAKSTAEAFQDRSGRGFWRALRSGHGDLSRLFPGVAT